ncbi:MAG: DUF4112 domain-containing protein [Terrimicrobiaceae bacterium]|nr:DUF4112 domain-containing protein [Terrimicrobiaceae bacterium]
METKPIDFEILPPKNGRDIPDLSRLIAWLLDDLIPIPGTRFRIGLDPIIGLIPGFGDSSTAVLSSMILLHGLRAGVPRIVLVRMALNVLINSLVGAIPGAGDLFSAFFKSNRRNYELLERHGGGSASGSSTAADWAFVTALIAGLLLIVIAASIGVAFLAFHLFKLLIAS